MRLTAKPAQSHRPCEASKLVCVVLHAQLPGCLGKDVTGGWKEGDELRMLDLAPSLFSLLLSDTGSWLQFPPQILSPAGSHQSLCFSQLRHQGLIFLMATVCLAVIRASQKER